jgi:hypothetical protein
MEQVANTRASAWRQRPTSARARARDVVVAAASLAVIGLLVLYAVAAPSAKLTASVGSVVPRPGNTAVVEGRVLDAGGGGLGGAEIVVRSDGRQLAAAHSRDDGTFRIDLGRRCAAYDVSIQAHSAGANVHTATSRRLCPGDALPVDAHVITEGHFLWVPGPR